MFDSCRSKRLRTKLLAERDLKLEPVLDLAAVMEASERQAAQVAQDAEPVNIVSGLGWRERQKQPKVNDRRATHDSNWCTKCGRRGHTADASRCTQTDAGPQQALRGHEGSEQGHYANEACDAPLDELITAFNGATVFSKIDLRLGYQQLVLHPSSVHITAFSTHVGLYRYKRLSFGITVAEEVFQHEIQTVIQGVSGAIKISDDIAVVGVDQCSHDKALDDVLHKLQAAGLTANLEKCEFRKKTIEFFGLTFSGEGVSPDPKKVADFHKAAEPKNASEVRSFLGMAQRTLRLLPSPCERSRSRTMTGNGERKKSRPSTQ